MYSIDTSQLVYFTIHELKMFAPAQVNGETMLAYLDTAATGVTVSSQVAKGLPQEGNVRVQSAFGEREFDKVTVSIEFMGNAFAKINARVHDGESTIPFRSGVTLGGQILFRQALIYDFHVLGLLHAGGVDRDGWEKVPSEFLDIGLCVVEMKAGGKKIKALFDTGAGVTVINSAHVKGNGLILGSGFRMDIWDATGAVSKQEIKSCRGLYVGEIQMPPFDAIEVDLSNIEETIGQQIDLVFGANAMLKSGFRWLFDAKHGEVLITP